MKNCHDCGAKTGEQHKKGCDIERCPCCNGQLISCGCHKFEHPNWNEYEDNIGLYWWPKDNIREKWSGVMMNLYEDIAIKDNKYVIWVEGKGWKNVSKDHPGAIPDLNYGAEKAIKICPYM